MPPAPPSLPDIIRILVSTDNHVGYEERDPVRKDDSSRTFDEVMQLARAHDVDMVLLGGDLFHDNKPSRRAMYQVMRSLRQNCLGDRPCELEFLSDPNAVFEGAFPYVNYEDPDINVSIPVFSIHGNHDDPSGEGHLCSLDLLQCAGLVNYYGRINEADRIQVKPVLLQKGTTRLAMYGLSNVRDERMFRTFRDGHVKWFRPRGGPNSDDDDGASPWFNLLTVHQNHHAHTATSYLPENVLPTWMDLVIWGHEHECLIDPTRNPETGFHVMQPGSSVATSLIPGEAVPKHVAILSITGRDFRVQKIPLKTVRPMVIREVVLARDERFKKLATKQNNRQELTKRLMAIVDEMIAEARDEWAALHEDRTPDQCPLPLVRLKVEYTPPDGGSFDIENPQRFSSRFAGRAANSGSIVYFYKKKTHGPRDGDADEPEPMDATGAPGEEIKVEELVRNFLSAQSLKLFPQAPFGDAVNTFVIKDDVHAMDVFVKESLSNQVDQMLTLDPDEPDPEKEDLDSAMERYKKKIDALFKASGGRVGTKKGTRRVLKPKPDDWDSDMNDHWADRDDSWEEVAVEEGEEGASSFATEPRRTTKDGDGEMIDVDEAPVPRGAAAKRGRGGKATATKASSSSSTTAKPKAPPKTTRATAASTRARPKRRAAGFVVADESDDQVDDSDDPVIVPPTQSSTTRPRRAAAARGATTQTTLDFSQATTATTTGSRAVGSRARALVVEDDDISDDPFEPARRTRRR